MRFHEPSYHAKKYGPRLAGPGVGHWWSGFVLTVALCIGCVSTMTAQPYPVTTIVQTTSFSPFLEDYTQAGRLLVTLISTDERPSYAALLRLRISVNGVTFHTRNDYLPPPLLLQRQQPLVLTGAQLAAYFDPANLEVSGGGWPDLLTNGGRLPDGPISICAEVYDYQRFFDPPVSNSGCARGLLQLQAVPELLLPEKRVTATRPQQVRFVWQARHAGAAAQYTLEIYEAPTGFSPDMIVQATAPLFTTTVVGVTEYLYTDRDPLLTPGHTYLTRLRVRDLANQVNFQNDGWTNVYTWRYDEMKKLADAASCLTKLESRVDTIAPHAIELSWNTVGSIPNSFSLIVRQQNGQTDTLSIAGSATDYRLDQLQAATAYALSLCGLCPDGRYYCDTIGWVHTRGLPCGTHPALTAGASPPNTLRLQWSAPEAAEQVILTLTDLASGDTLLVEQPEPSQSYYETTYPSIENGFLATVCYRCPGVDGWVCDSLRNDPPSCAQAGPLNYDYQCSDTTGLAPFQELPLVTSLSEGDSVWAGDFLVVLTSVSGGGPFFGEGHVAMPYLNQARINVRLIGISVNTHCRMVGGTMNITGVGVALIGGELAGALNDMVNLLETTEQILATASTVMHTLDAIIAKVEPYLPDSVLQQLQAAQVSLANAQSAYEAAKAGGDPAAIAAAENALQQAAADLKAANKAYQAALLALFKDMLEILAAVIRELWQDCDVPDLEAAYRTAETALDRNVDGHNRQMIDALPAAGSAEVDWQLELAEFSEEPLADTEDADFLELANTFYRREMSYLVCLTLRRLEEELDTEEEAQQLVDLLAEVGLDLMETVGAMLKDNQEQTAIVAAVKEQFVEGIRAVLQRAGYGS